MNVNLDFFVTYYATPKGFQQHRNQRRFQRRFDVVECECEIFDFKEDFKEDFKKDFIAGFIAGFSSLMNRTPWSLSSKMNEILCEII